MSDLDNHDNRALRQHQVVRLRQGAWNVTSDTLVVEEPLEVRVGRETLTVTMRTPGDDFALVRGLLLTEGIIETSADIGQMRYCDMGDDTENIVTVALRRERPAARRWQRILMSGSSCGLCGKSSIDALAAEVSPLQGTSAVSEQVLLSLPDTLRAHQSLFAQTGGLHAVGLFTADGECLCVFEDIGRHNAADKAIGYGVENGWLPWAQPGEPIILLVSGRASFEITQKALVARIPMVCAVSAASSLGAELAEANNQTLVGFLRTGAMTIYCGAQRIGGANT